MNMLHKAMIEDDEVTERLVPGWPQLEKATREYLEVVAGMQKDIDSLKARYDQALKLSPKMFQLCPDVDSLFGESPLRPGNLKLSVKLHMRKAGFDFISIGTPTMADVKIKSLTESAKEATRWLFKNKPKE